MATKKKPTRKAGGEQVKRKSLMMGLEAHATLTEYMDKFDVSQPELVDALITCVDKQRLMAALTKLGQEKAQREKEAAEREDLLTKIGKNLSVAELRALLGREST